MFLSKKKQRLVSLFKNITFEITKKDKTYDNYLLGINLVIAANNITSLYQYMKKDTFFAKCV